jgi:acetoin utilization protein AcuB
MTPNVRTVSPKTTLADAMSVCRTHDIRHLPVLEGDRLVGLVTDRDLRSAMPPIWADDQNELKEALHTRTVDEVMDKVPDIITTSPDLPVEEAGRLLYENRIGCLPVMEGDRLVGIITESDLLRAFVELFGTNQPSSRLEVRMSNRPGELARVVRVIGIEMRINITGMVCPPSDGGESMIAIMHVGTLNPSPLIDALRKLGYAVGWPSLDAPGRYVEVQHANWEDETLTLPL